MTKKGAMKTCSKLSNRAGRRSVHKQKGGATERVRETFLATKERLQQCSRLSIWSTHITDTEIGEASHSTLKDSMAQELGPPTHHLDADSHVQGGGCSKHIQVQIGATVRHPQQDRCKQLSGCVCECVSFFKAHGRAT